MRIGLQTNSLAQEGMIDLEEIAAWAEDNGFEDLEVGPAVRLERRTFDKVVASNRIGISALIYCRNFLSQDKEEAGLHIAELKKRITLAGEFGIRLVITSTGIDKSLEEGVYDRADAIRKIPERSLDQVVEVFAPMFDLAEKYGVRIAFENCPLMGNIAISPVMWRMLFARLDSQKAGLCYDPSHLVWQMIDPYAPVSEFADRIFHIHAKDTEISRKRLSECGFLTDFSWWNYRIPGHGELDWGRLLKELKRCGFDGTVSMEHEDPEYEGSLAVVKEGLMKGKEYLLPFIKA